MPTDVLEESLPELSADIPVALLPVRLEVRFAKRTAANLLLVRIYPDELNVVPGEQPLTTHDLALATRFWELHDELETKKDFDTSAASLPVLRREAQKRLWGQLVRGLGFERALRAARETRPGGPGGPGPQPTAAAARGPHATLLPDAWLIVGERDKKPVFSKLISSVTQQFPVAPNASDGQLLTSASDGHAFTKNDPARWLVDFNEALAKGMAAEIEVTDDVFNNGVQALYVLGIRKPSASRTVLSEAAALTDLLNVHAARERVAFLAPGTPTNNTKEARSDWSSRPDIFKAYENLVGLPRNAVPGTSGGVLRGAGHNALNFSVALGLPTGTLENVPGALNLEQFWARQMMRALFPVTLGEVLMSFARPKGELDDDATKGSTARLDVTLPFAAEYVSSFLRARGTLPTLRVSRQPYGILPITPLQNLKRLDAEPAQVTAIIEILTYLRWFWEQAAERVLRIADGVDEGTTSDTLVRVLQLGPVPARYAVQEVTGPLLSEVKYLADTQVAMINNIDLAKQTEADLTMLYWRKALFGGVPHLPKNSVLEVLQDYSLRRVMVDFVRDQEDDEPKDYLKALLEDVAKSVEPQVFLTRNQPPLLFTLLQTGLRLAKQWDQAQLLHHFGSKGARLYATTQLELRDSDLVRGKLVAQQFATALSELREPTDLVFPSIDAKTANELFTNASDVKALAGELLTAFPQLPPTFLSGYGSTLEAAEAIASSGLSDDELRRLIGETLALYSNRYDAWCTSLAQQRLVSLRDKNPEGLQLGYWGLLIDVTRSQAKVAAPQPDWAFDDDLDLASMPLHAARRQVGYAHAPSLQHAVMSGILRAGELTHAKDAKLGTIELTSQRVRRARDIVECVRNGQPIGVVLGCMVERALHDRGAHQAVDDLRKAFPQEREVAADSGVAVASDNVAPNEVLEGLDLYRCTDDVATLLTDAAEAQTARDVVRDLREAVDAVSDLLVAEGVYGIVTNQPERASVTFDALATGGAQPNELLSIVPPQSGDALTHRVLLTFDKKPNGDSAGWRSDRARVRMSEHLEQWARNVLGRADDREIADGVKLSELGLCALDVIAEATTRTFIPSVDAEADGGTSSPFQSVLADRIRAHGAGAEPGKHFEHIASLAAATGDMLASARPALAADLVAPKPATDTERAIPALLTPIAELRIQQEGIMRVLRDLDEDVREIGQTRPIQVALKRMSELSLPGSYGDDSSAAVDTAVAEARSMLADIDKLFVDALNAAKSAKINGKEIVDKFLENGTGTHSLRREAIQLLLDPPIPPGETTKPVFAGTATLLTRIARRLGGPTLITTFGVASELRQSTITHGPLATKEARLASIEGWLDAYGRVRPQLAKLDDVRLFTEPFGRDPMPLSVMQLPKHAEDEWLGGELPDRQGSSIEKERSSASPAPPKNPLRRWHRPKGPRTHVVCVGNLSDTATQHAIVLDDFHEVLPAQTVNTGLAVHYDGPNARPPQSLLLAVHPDPSQPWSYRLLYETLREALALTRMRAVELEQLQGLVIDDALPLTFVRGKLATAGPNLKRIKRGERQWGG